jgi:hypothetical protein
MTYDHNKYNYRLILDKFLTDKRNYKKSDNNILAASNKLEEHIIKNNIQFDEKTIQELKIGIFNLNYNKFFEHKDNLYYNQKLQNALCCIVNSLINDEILSERFFEKYSTQINKILVRSAFGDVYKVLHNNDELFAIKASKTKDNSIEHECLIGMLGLNKLRYKIPNFMCTYGVFYYNTPIVQDENNYKMYHNNGKCAYLVMENINNSKSLKSMLSDISTKDFCKIYLQLINALNIAYKEYDFTHYDLHTSNILIQKKKYNIPIYNNDEIIKYIKCDYVAKIIDYGKSHINANIQEMNEKISFSYDTSKSFYKKGNPLYDAYKLICFSAQYSYIDGRHDLVDICSKIYDFFNEKNSIKTRISKNIKAIKNSLNSRDYYVYNPNNDNLTLDKFIKYIINIFKLSKHKNTIDKIYNDNDKSLNLLDNTKKPTSLKDIIYINQIIDTIDNSSYKNTLEQCIKNFDYKSQYEKEQKRVFEKYNILKNKVLPYIIIKEKKVRFKLSKNTYNTEENHNSLYKLEDRNFDIEGYHYVLNKLLYINYSINELKSWIDKLIQFKINIKLTINIDYCDVIIKKINTLERKVKSNTKNILEHNYVLFKDKSNFDEFRNNNILYEEFIYLHKQLLKN